MHLSGPIPACLYLNKSTCCNPIRLSVLFHVPTPPQFALSGTASIECRADFHLVLFTNPSDHHSLLFSPILLHPSLSLGAFHLYIFRKFWTRTPYKSTKEMTTIKQICKLTKPNNASLIHLASVPNVLAYSRSSSYKVSMWSDVKAIGTRRMFLWFFAASPRILSLVCGPSQGKGPT